MSHSALAAGLRHLRGVVAAQQHRDDSDEQLLHAFAADRDENAFAVLVRRHGPMVLHLCRRVLGQEQDAEDVFQATFLVLAQNAASLRKKTALPAFLHGTAYRLALSVKRAAARRRKHEACLGARTQPGSPADDLCWSEVQTLVDEEIARLPEKYRSVFILCCLEEQGRAEAARRLGLKEGTLSSRLAEARQRLQRRLSRRGVELTAALAACTLASQPASALSPVLFSSTLNAALATALGKGTAGLVSAPVAGLVKSAASAAVLSKTKMAAVMLLIVSALAGAGAWACRSAAAPQPAPRQAETPPSPSRSVPQRKAEGPQQKKRDVTTVKGRVLGPDGKPVQGARLYSTCIRVVGVGVGPVVALAQPEPTGADGRFDVILNDPAYNESIVLFAVADGLGVDWVDLSDNERPKDVTLRLTKDVPIRGRVVNTEGRPVAGVSVSITQIEVPTNEKLPDYLKGWRRNFTQNLSTPRKRLYGPLDTFTGLVKTDKEGRFTVRGAGGERIVHVTFSGRGVARSTPFVITRRGFDAKPYNAALQQDALIKRFVERNHFPGLYSPSFTFVAESGKTIEGVIKDADSGKPIAGCRLWIPSSFGTHVTSVSDAQGAYRLTGLHKKVRGYDVLVQPPLGSLYLGRRIHAADTPGLAKVPFNIELSQGATVSGRVVDRQTGKGVRCFLRAEPLADNPFFALRPSNNYIITLPTGATDKEGRFRISALPGPTLLMARVNERENFHGERLPAFRRAVPDPDHKDRFQLRQIRSYRLWSVATAGNGLRGLNGENAVKVIDIKKNGETNVKLVVDRGVTARIVVQDADGKPLTGAWASGLTDMMSSTYKLPEAMATVFALDPKQPRTMAFYHAEKKLGGTATVRGDENEPVIAKLAPLGRVTGRLLDDNGDPLKGAEIWINTWPIHGSELYRVAILNGFLRIPGPDGKPLHTGKDGRFHLDFIVPNMKFTLNLIHEGTFFRGDQRIGFKQIKPGETLDLGDLRLKPAR